MKKTLANVVLVCGTIVLGVLCVPMALLSMLMEAVQRATDGLFACLDGDCSDCR